MSDNVMMGLYCLSIWIIQIVFFWAYTRTFERIAAEDIAAYGPRPGARS